MDQQKFAYRVVQELKDEESVLGLAVGGSWLTEEIDQWSDLDLLIVTREDIDADKTKMLGYANRFGNLLSAFTGEHVGERRLLICLYHPPLLHVDIKFVTLSEFAERIENPHILLDESGALRERLATTAAAHPTPDFQWIEDRFWTWVHYSLVKIGRSEYLEAMDFMGYLRMQVFGPLLHVKNNSLPRGVRRVESKLPAADLELLRGTISPDGRNQLLASLRKAVDAYRGLRSELFGREIKHNIAAERAVMDYFEHIELRPN